MILACHLTCADPKHLSSVTRIRSARNSGLFHRCTYFVKAADNPDRFNTHCDLFHLVAAKTAKHDAR